MKKSYFTLALAVLVSCFLAVSVTNAQGTKQTNKAMVVKEGVGFNGIAVGRSTSADVAKKFGKDFKLKTYKKYSSQMIYSNGLSFYYCFADNRKVIFDIEIRAPFQAKTSKGVTLGKSTLEDIYKIYGKTTDGLQYRGVNFYYVNNKGKKTVTVIDIVENAGIRQCKESK